VAAVPEPTSVARLNGDAGAAALCERYRERVLRYCLFQLGSREEAEDAAQATFMRALVALRRGTTPQVEIAWLLAIAKNVCRTRRATGPSAREVVRDPDDFETVAARTEASDDRARLAEAVAGLPARQRKAVLLREWQGLTYDEISEELGITKSATEMLIFRARRGLARALRELGAVAGWVKSPFGGGAALKLAAAGAVAVTATTATVAVVVVERNRHSGRAPAQRSAPAAGTTTPSAVRLSGSEPQSPVRLRPAAHSTAAPSRGERTPVAPATAGSSAPDVSSSGPRAPTASEPGAPPGPNVPTAPTSRAEGDRPTPSLPGPPQPPAPTAPDLPALPPVSLPPVSVPAPSVPAVPSVPSLPDVPPLPDPPALPSAPPLPAAPTLPAEPPVVPTVPTLP
jgi:RNA polymerase sigma factor (sigma-70 family)